MDLSAHDGPGQRFAALIVAGDAEGVRLALAAGYPRRAMHELRAAGR